MAEMKTKPTTQSVTSFLSTVDPSRQADCKKILAIMKKATGAQPRMWGPSIVGFGSYHYEYGTGRGGDWFLAGFSPRKRDLTLYIHAAVAQKDLLARLGKHKAGKSCVYIKRLADVDVSVLEEMIRRSLADIPGRTA